MFNKPIALGIWPLPRTKFSELILRGNITEFGDLSADLSSRWRLQSKPARGATHKPSRLSTRCTRGRLVGWTPQASATPASFSFFGKEERRSQEPQSPPEHVGTRGGGADIYKHRDEHDNHAWQIKPPSLIPVVICSV